MKKFGLSKDERIKSEKDFKLIYSAGKTAYSGNQKLKAVYIIEGNAGEGKIKIAAAVSKRAGNAVWRNRVKRLIRESFRLNKHLIDLNNKEEKFFVRIVFSPGNLSQIKNKLIKLVDIMPALTDLLKKINGSL
ncbi:MAG: ribonuclease P protein component [Ignavibacteria bacterium]